MAEKTQKYGKWMLTAAAALWCVVIWQFSLTPADASSATSGAVWAFLNDTLAAMNVSFRFTPIMVRKIAHFTEFFVLGVLVCSALLAHRVPCRVPFAIACAVAVATVDECIQLFVPGRAAAVTDVLLDSAGALVGVLAFWGIWRLVIYIKKKSQKNSKKISKTY